MHFRKKVQKNSEDDNKVYDDDDTEEGDWSDDDAKSFGWNFILQLVEKVASPVQAPTRRVESIQREFLDQVCLLRESKEKRIFS